MEQLSLIVLPIPQIPHIQSARGLKQSLNNNPIMLRLSLGSFLASGLRLLLLLEEVWEENSKGGHYVGHNGGLWG